MPAIGFGKAPAKQRKKYSSDPRTRAAELIAEGRFGGRQPGAGRPRKPDSQKVKRASSVVAQAARDNADLIASTFTDAMRDPDASDRQRMMAGKALVGIELQEEERRREDERDGRDLPPMPQDRDALARALAEKFARNPILAAEMGAILSRAALIAADPPENPRAALRRAENALSGGDSPVRGAS